MLCVVHDRRACSHYNSPRGLDHVLYAHGERLYFDQLLDYPTQALSWAELSGGPSTTTILR